MKKFKFKNFIFCFLTTSSIYDGIYFFIYTIHPFKSYQAIFCLFIVMWYLKINIECLKLSLKLKKITLKRSQINHKYLIDERVKFCYYSKWRKIVSLLDSIDMIVGLIANCLICYSIAIIWINTEEINWQW